MKTFGRILLTLGLLAAAVAAMLAYRPASAEALPLTSGSHIVFQTSSGGAIYIMNPDGSGLRYLTTGMDPALSPDGKTVAFTRWTGSNNGSPGNLYIINVDGSGERKVLTNDVSQPKSPSWSPDGSQIILQYQKGGVIYNVNGCVPPGGRIPPGAVDVHQEGNQICYTVLAHPYWDLGLVNMSAGTLNDMPSDRYSFSPTWNPAQPWQVIYHGYNGLQSIDLTSGTSTTIGTDINDQAPVFSPDGKQLVVSYRQGDHWEIHVLNADGSGEVRVTETPSTVLANQIVNGQQPASWNNAAGTWSPDGKQILFLTDRSGQWEIWAANADGSSQHPILAGSAAAALHIQYNGVDERALSWR